MYRVIARLFAILFYLIVLLASVGFEIKNLWSTKSFFFVVFGTLLLSASGYRKGMGKDEIRNAVCMNTMTAAYLTTFIELFAKLSGDINGYEATMRTIAVSCRALLYGFIIASVLKQDTAEHSEVKREKIIPVPYMDERTDNPLPPPQDDRDKLRAMGLTQREIEIVELVRKNLTNKEIADKLFISETTVKKHLSNIFKKLKLSGRDELR